MWPVSFMLPRNVAKLALFGVEGFLDVGLEGPLVKPSPDGDSFGLRVEVRFVDSYEVFDQGALRAPLVVGQSLVVRNQRLHGKHMIHRKDHCEF